MSDQDKQIIRGYELHEQIGAGGFGAVYRAYQPLLKREVALKVILHQHANNADFIRRFEIEAELVARLEHPHIVPLFDYWREPDGAYLVLRLLRGGSLRDILNSGALPLKRTVNLLDQIAAGLHVAHRNGVVHRDIKPANILLDEDENAYLTDFGIAKSPDYKSESEEGISGSVPYISPEQLQAGTITPQTDIYALGVMVYEMLVGEHPFADATMSEMIFKHLQETLPDITDMNDALPPEVDHVIQTATAKDPSLRYSDAREMAAALRFALVGEAVITATAEALIDEEEYVDIPNPYKGLRAFQEADADQFYGRYNLVQRLLTRIAQTEEEARFLAVVGPSGSGKSSVVKAGLIPALRQGKVSGSADWFIVEMFPGTHPYEELESALLRVAVNPPASLIEQLQSDERGLVRAVKRILPGDESELLLVIDQFEELFTLVEEDNVRTRFLDNILSAIMDPRSRLRVVVTLRADFYDRPLHYLDFGEILRKRTEIVLPMSQEDLQAAVVQPAEHVGARLHSGLVEAIIADVGEQPGTLPLLQYALTELFERRLGRALTLEAYQSIGGVTGALAKRAEEIYLELDQSAQDITRQLFLRLVTLGEGTEDTRRRVRREELPDHSQTDAVIDRLGQARLLTFDRDPVTRGPTVEVAHEALIRNWERLREWITDNREGLHIHRRLTTASLEWQQSGNDPSFLASGARLAQFEAWAEQTSLVLNLAEQTLLTTSIDNQEELRRLDEARKEHEFSLQKRAANRLRYLVAGMAVFLIVAIGLTVFAFNKQQQADSEASNAGTQAAVAEANAATANSAQEIALVLQTTSERRADEGQSLVLAFAAQRAYENGNPIDALAYAFAANSLAEPPVLAQRTLADIAYGASPRQIFQIDNNSVERVQYIPETSYVVADMADSSVWIWDIISGEIIQKTKDPTDGRVVGLSSDGLVALSSHRDSDLVMWETDSGAIIQVFNGHTQGIVAAALSPDGTTVLSGSWDSTMILWDVLSGDILWRFEVEPGFRVDAVDYSADGKIAIAGIQHWIYLIDVLTGEVIRIIEESFASDYIASSPRDQTFISAGDIQGNFYIWDIETGEAILRPQAESGVLALAFSPDGGKVVTGSQGGEVSLWDVGSGSKLQTYRTDSVASVTFTPDGDSIIVVSHNGTMSLWDVDLYQYHTLNRLGRVLSGTDEMALSPDGTILAAVANGGVMLWDLTSGELVRELRVLNNSLQSVAISPDGHTILSGTMDGAVLWDILSGEALRTFSSSDGRIERVIFHPLGESALLATNSGRIAVWDVETGEELQSLEEHTQKVTDLAFAPDGYTALSASWDQTLILWDLATGESIHTFLGHTDRVDSVAISSDGRTALSASEDQTLILWDLTTGDPLRTFRGHTGWVEHVTFSPDNQFALSSSNNEVLLWDISRGDVLRNYQNEFKDGQRVIFGRDGNTLITISNFAIIVRRFDTLDILLRWTLENRAVRDLTCEERRDFRVKPDCDERGLFPTRPPLPTTTPAPLRTTNTPLPTIPSPTSAPTPTSLPGPEDLPFAVMPLLEIEDYIHMNSYTISDAQSRMFIIVPDFENALIWGDLAYTQIYRRESDQSVFQVMYTGSPFSTLAEWSAVVNVELPMITKIDDIEVAEFQAGQIQLAIFIYQNAFVVVATQGEQPIFSIVQALLEYSSIPDDSDTSKNVIITPRPTLPTITSLPSLTPSAMPSVNTTLETPGG